MTAAYAAFAPSPTDTRAEPGFPSTMPNYYRHASHFEAHTHVRALMRLRCCSDPFLASPNLHCGAHRTAPRVRTERLPTPMRPWRRLRRPSTHSETYATLRAHPRFAHLFSSPLPPSGGASAGVCAAA